MHSSGPLVDLSLSGGFFRTQRTPPGYGLGNRMVGEVEVQGTVSTLSLSFSQSSPQMEAAIPVGQPF